MRKTSTPVPWCKVDVDSLPCEVVLRPRSEREVKEQIAAQFDSTTLQIWIADSISREHAESTLLHEVGHALLYARGIVLSDELEEKLVNPVASAVYSVLKRNGWLKLPPMPPKLGR